MGGGEAWYSQLLEPGALIGIILGVLGILIGLWAAWWFARGPRLLYQASGASLITAPDDNSRISVQYDGEQVERVTQSIVWLWRRGRGAVKGEDVVPDDPITLSVPDGSVILDVAVLRQSVPTNNVTTDFQKDGGPAKSVTLGLAYLDRGQGAAIEVYHTAPRPGDVSITGTVIGIPEGIRRSIAGSTTDMPVTLLGATVVTFPTGAIPRHLRGAGRQPRPLRDVTIDVGLAVLSALVPGAGRRG
jgi:hypothetical protein